MKSIKDYTLQELCALRKTIEGLPVECEVLLNIKGNPSIEEYIENYESDFFNVTEEDYKNIVGKIFTNKNDLELFRYSIFIKIVGFNPENPAEFFYEEYRKGNNGWHQDDYNYLQDYIDQNPNYEQYRDRPEVFVNIASENMYMLGKDGNLYTDYSCGGDYWKFVPIDDEITFRLIKQDCLNNE